MLMILVGEPSLGKDEKTALAEVVDANWITMGSRVSGFERAFAESHGVAAAAAVSSCTAGLHLALAALDIGPGDEVLVPSMTFVATANCVLYVGATPVFVDIESLHRPLISIEDAARKCTERTRAVIVMHYAGYLVDRQAWLDFAQSRGLLLIEDAAHAAGAPGAGTIGDVAVFSFYGNKNMTTAEGGMIFAREESVLNRIRQMRALGMSSGTHERLQARAPLYDVTMLGWNYRMDEFRAAVGLVQLRSLRKWNETRRDLVSRYRDVLSEYCPAVSVPFGNAVEPSAYHLLPAILPAGSDRKAIMERMRDTGVQTTFHYPPVHALSFYRSRYPSGPLPETDAFAERELTLPLHPKMTNSDVRRVADALANALCTGRADPEASQ
ncbi:MAG: DegT/DnrJ/EryC1/StrS aminotransferase family protein [Rhodopila sp.]|nr:DegT/DnrJ/EryC1/StrS aminotransferase family protein [Rhodopila sp.]